MKKLYREFLAEAHLAPAQRRQVEDILADLQVNYERYMRSSEQAYTEAWQKRERLPHLDPTAKELNEDAVADLKKVLTEEQLGMFKDKLDAPVTFVESRPFDLDASPDGTQPDAG